MKSYSVFNKINMKKTIILILLISVFLKGCASITHGRASWLRVETNPSNIEVKLYGINNGESIKQTTPFRVELDKGSDYKLVIETPNYKSEEVVIRRKITGWFWGNILVGWIVGFAIDALSHNMWDHNQHLITLDLEKLSTAPDIIKINLPLVFKMKDGQELTKVVPLTFHKKIKT